MRKTLWKNGKNGGFFFNFCRKSKSLFWIGVISGKKNTIKYFQRKTQCKNFERKNRTVRCRVFALSFMYTVLPLKIQCFVLPLKMLHYVLPHLVLVLSLSYTTALCLQIFISFHIKICSALGYGTVGPGSECVRCVLCTSSSIYLLDLLHDLFSLNRLNFFVSWLADKGLMEETRTTWSIVRIKLNGTGHTLQNFCVHLYIPFHSIVFECSTWTSVRIGFRWKYSTICRATH